MKTKELVLIALCTTLMIVATFIKIPIGPVPITLQLPIVLLIGFLVGTRLGLFSVLLYILIGLVGIPVFTSGGGLGSVLSPTFGFVLGFLPAVYITGRAHNANVVKQIMFGLFAIASVFVLGGGYFYMIMNVVLDAPMDVVQVLHLAILPFLLKDAISAVLASLFAHLLTRRGMAFTDKSRGSNAYNSFHK